MWLSQFPAKTLARSSLESGLRQLIRIYYRSLFTAELICVSLSGGDECKNREMTVVSVWEGPYKHHPTGSFPSRCKQRCLQSATRGRDFAHCMYFYRVNKVKYLRFSEDPYCCHTVKITLYHLAPDVPGLQAVKMLQLVSMKSSMTLQLISER